MKALDVKETMNNFLMNPKKRIPKTILDSICKCHKKEACRYLCLTVKGFVCVKHSPMKDFLDDMVAKNGMAAHGDNCKGL